MKIGPKERADYKEMVARVVVRFNEIEFQLTAVLIGALGIPNERRDFFYRVLFNNSIVPFAQKVKLLANLREEMGWPKFDWNSFHRLSHIRNQFAHSLPREHITANVLTEEQRVEAELIIMLESIDGSGKLNSTRASAAINEFKKHDDEVSKYLRSVK